MRMSKPHGMLCQSKGITCPCCLLRLVPQGWEPHSAAFISQYLEQILFGLFVHQSTSLA